MSKLKHKNIFNVRNILSSARRIYRKIPLKLRGSHGFMATRDRFADLRKIVNTHSPLIVDGGANVGNMIAIFLGQYDAPIIHAFEPIPELVKSLKKRFECYNNVYIHGNALGSESKKISFNVLVYEGASSVLVPSEILKYYHGSNMDINQTISVKQVRLDEILRDEIDILKLDLQGYELEALKGCDNLLKRIKTITLEVEFVPLYEGAPIFGDIDIFLRRKGFKLFNLYELYTHPDGQLTAGDAIYLNEQYF